MKPKLPLFTTVVRSITHPLGRANTRKAALYDDFLFEYRRAVNAFVDFIWNNRFEYTDKKGRTRVFDIAEGLLDLPKCIDYNCVDFETKLYARALRSAVNQARGIVESAIAEQRKRQHRLDDEAVRRKYEEQGFVKPSPKHINAELDSNCALFSPNTKKTKKRHYDGYIVLKSIGKAYGDIVIPIVFNRRYYKWKEEGFELMKSSFLFKDGCVVMRMRKKVEMHTEGVLLGADQGMRKTMVFSDGTVTPLKDSQGKTLKSLYAKLARKKWGSKAYRRARIELFNFIRWEFNELLRSGYFEDVLKIVVEDVWNIRYKKRSSRYLKGWSNPDIVSALVAVAEVSGVHILYEHSGYMSKRCSACGFVKASNRKDEVYECPHCGFKGDADLNAAINHTLGLPPVPRKFYGSGLSTTGFFWNQDGVFSLDGEELVSPSSSEPRH